MDTGQLEIEPKTAEILDSIKTIFASKGFDGASMQDLARAAGMSAGNFYRYFPSKNAIIEGIIAREIEQVRAEFAQVIGSPRPLDAFRQLLRRRVEMVDQCEGPIWAEIEAAASRRPDVAQLLGRMEGEVTHNLVAVFARITALTEVEAERRFAAHARLIVLMVQGLSIRCAVTDPEAGPDRELAALVGAAIERTIADIAASAKAGGADPEHASLAYS